MNQEFNPKFTDTNIITIALTAKINMREETMQ